MGNMKNSGVGSSRRKNAHEYYKTCIHLLHNSLTYFTMNEKKTIYQP